MAIKDINSRLSDAIDETDAVVSDKSFPGASEKDIDQSSVVTTPEDIASNDGIVTEDPTRVAGLGKILEGIAIKGATIKKAIDKTPSVTPPTRESIESQKIIQEAAKKSAEEKQITIKQLFDENEGRVKDPVKVIDNATNPNATQSELASVVTEVKKAEGVDIPGTGGILIRKIYDDEKTTRLMADWDKVSDKTLPNIDYDFNYNKIQTTDDILNVITKFSEQLKKETDIAKRGVMSDDLVKDMASRLNMTDEVLNAKIGQTFNAEQLLAARHLLVRSASRLDDLSTKIKDLPATQEDYGLLLEFKSQLATHSAIQLTLKAAQTEAGRALRSFRIPVDGLEGIADPKAIQNLLNEMGGKNNIKNMAKAYDSLMDDQKARFIEAGGKLGWDKASGIWKELYYSSMLLNPATIERAGFGTAVMTLFRSIDTAFAGTVGKGLDKLISPVFGSRSSDNVYASEAVIELALMIKSIPDSLSTFVKVLKTDAPVYKGGDIDKSVDPMITSKLFDNPDSPFAQVVDFGGKMIRLGQRGLVATDEAAKAMVSTMETRRLAAREAFNAMENGVDADTALKGMAQEIATPNADIIAKVDRAVLEPTLQSPMGDFGNAIMSIRNKLPGPVGTVLMPFVKSVINMEKQMLIRTPFAPLMKEVRDELAAGGARRQMALGKIGAGSSFMAMSYYLATSGVITGAGPTDPKLKQFLRDNGWQPYSVQIGTTEDGKPKYYSYAGLEPIGQLLGVAATLAEVGSVYGKDGDSDWTDLLAYSALMPFKYVTELPLMSSMKSFIDTVDMSRRSPELAADAAAKFFGGISQNFVAGVVPVPMPGSAFLRNIENYFDPVKRTVTPDPTMTPIQREFDYLFRNWMSKTPILSEDIKPARSIWGEEIKTGQNNALYWIAPFNKTESNLDEAERKVVDISRMVGKMIFSMPDRKIQNIKLNDNEYSDLLLQMNLEISEGKTMKQKIYDVLMNPSPARLEEMSRGAYKGVVNDLSNIISDYKDMAWQSDYFASQYPNLVRDIKVNKDAARRNYFDMKRQPEFQ